jgi:hypothetical protein
MDFISDDRDASPDGKTFAQRRWSTPLGDYRTMGAYRIATRGEGRWHATGAEAEYAYVELHIDDITYKHHQGSRQSRQPRRRRRIVLWWYRGQSTTAAARERWLPGLLRRLAMRAGSRASSGGWTI